MKRDIEKGLTEGDKEAAFAAPAVSGRAAPELADTPAPKHKKTLAERIFNVGVYTGIALAANAALSVYVAKRLKYGSWKDGFDKAVNATSEHVGEKIFADKTRALNSTKTLLQTAALCSGGILLMIPVKKIEDYKVAIVCGIQKTLDRAKALVGIKPDSERNARTEDAIRREPRQSWASILEGRAIAMATVFPVAFSFPGTVEAIENKGAVIAHHASGLLSKFLPFVSPIPKPLTAPHPHTGKPYTLPGEQQPRSVQLAKLWTSDIAVSALAAGVLFLASKFISRKHAEKRAHEEQADAPLPVSTARQEIAEDTPASRFTERFAAPVLSYRERIARNTGSLDMGMAV